MKVVRVKNVKTMSLSFIYIASIYIVIIRNHLDKLVKIEPLD